MYPFSQIRISNSGMTMASQLARPKLSHLEWYLRSCNRRSARFMGRQFCPTSSTPASNISMRCCIRGEPSMRLWNPRLSWESWERQSHSACQGVLSDFTVLSFTASHGVSCRRVYSHNSGGRRIRAGIGSDIEGSVIPEDRPALYRQQLHGRPRAPMSLSY